MPWPSSRGCLHAHESDDGAMLTRWVELFATSSADEIAAAVTTAKR